MTDETPRGDSGPALAAVVARGTIDVPDFPKPGIVFKDLMPLFADGPAFRTVVDGIVAHHGADGFDVVAGVEARGFVVAAAVAYATGSGVVPQGQLRMLQPNVPEVRMVWVKRADVHILDTWHTGGLRGTGSHDLVVDDVLATGGTAGAALELVERAGGTVAGFTVLMELAFLQGRERLSPRTIHALLTV